MDVASFLNTDARATPWTSPETPLAEAVRIMAATGMGALPVLGRDGRLVGMVLERDILRLVAERRNGVRGLAVEEAMCHDILTVPAEAPAGTALAVMARSALRHMPVCDARGRLLGMVGIAEILCATPPGVPDAAPA